MYGQYVAQSKIILVNPFYRQQLVMMSGHFLEKENFLETLSKRKSYRFLMLMIVS